MILILKDNVGDYSDSYDIIVGAFDIENNKPDNVLGAFHAFKEAEVKAQYAKVSLNKRTENKIRQQVYEEFSLAWYLKMNRKFEELYYEEQYI